MVRRGGAAAARLLVALVCGWLLAGASASAEGFAVEDYFRIERVVELALSPDGRELAYVVEGQGRRRVWLRGVQAAAQPRLLPEIADASDLAWTGGELAFLSGRAGASQVFSYDPASGGLRQRTASADPVVGFRFAPRGGRLAYLTRAAAAAAPSLYEQFRTGDTGVLVDTETTSSHDFLNPDWNALVRPAPLKLWLAQTDHQGTPAALPGEPAGEIFWSPDGRKLSAAFVAADEPAALERDQHTSLGVLEAQTGRFTVIAAATRAAAGRPALAFEGGEWLADGRILVRRAELSELWVSEAFRRWTVMDPGKALPADSAWRAIEVYPRGLAFFPRGPDRLRVENTVEGVHSLFDVDGGRISRSALTDGLDGSSSLFRFSADGSAAAFVNESLVRPPEIYLKQAGTPARRMSGLNAAVAADVDFKAREVSWKGADGVTLKGWLIEPRSGAGPRPMVTHIHGGPAFPFPDAFVPYFDYWAYPLEAYASRGMAVFLPNYRGTHTFGREVASDAGGQAAEDIVRGVQALVDAGVADPRRLGLSGHSHGAYLGPLVLTRSRLFRAASFAEGVGDSLLMYELMSGQANREIHDPMFGASLYDDSGPYLADSADLEFGRVSTAGLFEAGAYTSPLFMMGLVKAARRVGLPAEFVVYPKTAHNLAIPQLQREAARRNLDWFGFWLQDRENPDGAAQYDRWRKMRQDWEAKLPSAAKDAKSTP